MTWRSSTRSCSKRPSTANTRWSRSSRRSGCGRGTSDARHRESRAGRDHARPVRHFHHVRVPDRVHADGARRVLRLLRDGRSHLQPAGPAHLLGDDERRADLDPAVRLHGLHHRARQHPRPPVPFVAARRRPGAGVAGAGDARDLRHLRDRHRHRRRLCHVDGAARLPGDAACRLRRQDRGRRGLRRRLPRHSDSAQRHADPVRRDRRRVGGQALRRRLLPRHHAGRALHALRHHHDAAQSEAGAEAAGRQSATCPS